MNPYKHPLSCLAALLFGIGLAVIIVQPCKTKLPASNPPVEEEQSPLLPGQVAVAVGKLKFDGASGTAALISPQRSDGRWDILAAFHTADFSVGKKGKFAPFLSNAPDIEVEVVAGDRSSDCMWLVTSEPQVYLSGLELANQPPFVDAACWHCGFGIDNPANREDGWVSDKPTSSMHGSFVLSVSHGDGGAPILDRNNRVIGVVSCTETIGQRAKVWGPSVEQIRELRPKDGEK